MAKTIEIKKTTISKFFLSFILGFAILYGLEHKGKFTFVEDRTANRYGKPSFSRSISLDTKVYSIMYSTYFGNEVKTGGNGFNMRDLRYSHTEFYKYTNTSYYYTQATIKDYKYGIYFSLGVFAVLMFFTYVKIKIS